MTIQQVRQLQRGDQVFWNDPDNGTCSRQLSILEIVERGEGAFDIVDVSGDSIGCFASELS